MFPRVKEVRHERNYVLHLTFADGSEGEIDLENELDGEIFIPLRNPQFFKQVRVDDDTHTVVWPNGADFAPEFLRERLDIRLPIHS